MRHFLFPVLLALPLAACASRPVIAVGEHGNFPRPAAFALLPDENREETAAAALTSKLHAAGFTPEGKAQFLFQVTQSELPGKAGLFVPQPASAGSPEQDWLTSPTRSQSKRTRRLIVSVTDASTGREVYRAYGTERYRPGSSDEGATLRQSVLSLLP